VAGAHAGVGTRFGRARAFFAQRIWETRLDQLPPGKALGYRAARIAYSAVHGLLWSDRLHVRAAALTYYTVLSLVPLLAFAFALLKGFGAYDTLIDQQVRPYVLQSVAGNPSLQSAFEQVLEFVSQTSVASLGVAGLIFLLYTATRLLWNIEGALNELWEARRARRPLEQLRDYVAIIVVTPLCLLLATGAGTVIQLLPFVQNMQQTLGLGRLLGSLGPLLTAFIGLLFLYRVLPNTMVRTRSALIGAAFGALLWYAALIAHVRFQIGVAKFNALYAGFGAIPIFLVWLQVSWLTVMVGAEIAATHQHERAAEQRRRGGAGAGDALRETLALSAMLQIARALLLGEVPPRLRALARALDVPDPVMRDLLERMLAAGLLLKSGPDSDPEWVLARVPERVRVKDVLDALHQVAPGARERLEQDGLDGGAATLLRELDQTIAAAPQNRTLRELVDTQA
jgi:membrane protein